MVCGNCHFNAMHRIVDYAPCAIAEDGGLIFCNTITGAPTLSFRMRGGIPESSSELRNSVGYVTAFWSGTVSINL